MPGICAENRRRYRLWNQMACLSPRVIYFLNKPTRTQGAEIDCKNDTKYAAYVTGSAFKAINRFKKSSQGSSKLDKDLSDVKSLIQTVCKITP